MDEQKQNIDDDQTKGIVSDEDKETAEDSNSLVIEMGSSKGVAIYRDYSKENVETSKLKRLIR